MSKDHMKKSTSRASSSGSSALESLESTVSDVTIPTPSAVLKESPTSTSRMQQDREAMASLSGVSVLPRKPSSMLGKRKRVDVAAPSMERNFITVDRAMADFLLAPEDLEGLKTTTRRSPYANLPEIVVLSRKDVVQRSNQKWGSPEQLRHELDKRNIRASDRTWSKGVRRLPRGARRLQSDPDAQLERQFGLRGPSGRVVVTAVVMNGATMVLKLVAWYHTSSHSMFSEFLHSLADTANQIIIAVGVHTSTKGASVMHPYGFSNMQFVTALISGVGIFCVGMGLSVYHGFSGLLLRTDMLDLGWAIIVMGISGIVEVTMMCLAVRSLWQSAKQKDISLLTFVMTAQDPSVVVVLTEDMAAVLSLLVSATCILVAQHTRSHIPDAVGSILVGLVLGAVACFIISSNGRKLVGRSIPDEQLQQINMELERDCMVRAILDVKGIDMGNNMVRYKAELDLDGRQLARAYLDQLDMRHILESLKNIDTVEALEEFMLDHGENVVDMIGGQIDRIEKNLKLLYPSIRHCDLEIL